MKTATIVSLRVYRAELQRRAKKTAVGNAGVPLPSINFLWQLLDKNISFAAWNEQQLGRLA